MATAARKTSPSRTPEFAIDALRKGKAVWFADGLERAFRDLMKRMTAALQDEDAQLARALDAGDELGAEYRKRGAPGLNYWVFEHNLVYSIFRAWAPSHRVLWDERLGAPWSTFDQTDRNRISNDNGKRRLIDLQVITDTKKPRWHFEVKWMNNERGLRSAKRDVKRLIQIRTSEKPQPRCFVIGIWWNRNGELKHDLDFQRGWLSSRVQPVYSAAFVSCVPSATRHRVEKGYIFLSVWEVMPKTA